MTVKQSRLTLRRQTVFRFRQPLHRAFIASHVPCLLRQVRGQGIDIVCCLRPAVQLCGKHRAQKGFPMQLKQLLPELCREIKARQVCFNVAQFKSILRLAPAKRPSRLIEPSARLKNEPAAKHTALPGPVPVPLILRRVLFTHGGKAVKHRAKKSGKGAFPPAVFLTDNIEAVCKGIIIIPQAAEVFYMTRNIFHSNAMIYPDILSSNLSRSRKSRSPILPIRSVL